MLIVEFFAGPGSGKTTMASGLWSSLKAEGYICEFVREYAQELIFQGRSWLLSEQVIVNAGQLEKYAQLRHARCPLAIADSSGTLGRIYSDPGDSVNTHLRNLIDEYYASRLRVLKVFVRRVKRYTSFGRGSSEELARSRDERIYRELGPFDYIIDGSPEGLRELIDKITPRLKEMGALHRNEDWSKDGPTTQK